MFWRSFKQWFNVDCVLGGWVPLCPSEVNCSYGRPLQLHQEHVGASRGCSSYGGHVSLQHTKQHTRTVHLFLLFSNKITIAAHLSHFICPGSTFPCVYNTQNNTFPCVSPTPTAQIKQSCKQPPETVALREKQTNIKPYKMSFFLSLFFACFVTRSTGVKVNRPEKERKKGF